MWMRGGTSKGVFDSFPSMSVTNSERFDTRRLHDNVQAFSFCISYLATLRSWLNLIYAKSGKSFIHASPG